ncbi:hypothetical protein Tco_0721769, partial [Tanacetum coccineum]
MIQYLKNTAGYLHAQLKDKSFDEVQKLFEKHMKWINSFVPMKEDLPSEKVHKEVSSEKKAEGSNRKKSIGRKRAKDKQEQESSKRHRVEDDKEEEVLKKCFKLAKEEEIAINAIPLAIKLYHVFSQLLSEFDREDLVNLWKLVKAKHRDNRPEEDFKRVLWGDLRVMFEPDVESEVWRSLQGYKRYPLTPITITNMLNKKLQADQWNEMVYQLLKLMIQKMNIKFRGGLLGLKGFLKLLLLSTASTKVYVAGLQLLEELLLAFALRNFDLEVMEFESAYSNTTAKLPILKLFTKMSVPVTVEEKTNKKHDMKARSLLLMALPNEHQLTFSQYNDAKTMFAAIETRFGGSRRFTSSTNDVNTAKPAFEVSPVSPNINTASPQDLEQIHEDDLDAIDLKWQLSLLSMRPK